MKIYFTSDVHGYIFPTDYLDRTYKNTGLLCESSSFEKNSETLIIDGGDNLQGSALSYYMHLNNDSKTIGEIMSSVGYDFFTLGNHDFNYGYDFLSDYVENFKAQCICANIKDKKGNINIKPYEIIEVSQKKIAITGIVTDWIKIWEKSENIENFEIFDTFESIKKVSEQIKNVDFKICIYHGGIEEDIKSGEKLSTNTENIAAKIARELDFDLLLTGHQHMDITNLTIENTHIVQCPANGEKYVEIEVDLNNKNIQSISKYPNLPPKENIYEKYKNLDLNTQNFLDKPLTTLDGDYLPEDKLTMAIKGSALADFINKIQLEVSKADISVTSFANEIKGFNREITIRDVLLTYRFPNTLIVLEIDGKSLRDALEQNYTYIEYANENFQISEKFLAPKVEHYNFDFFYGLDFELNLKNENYAKIGQMVFNNKEIKDSDKFSIVMNNYRASGAGNFPMYKNLKVIKRINIEVSELLIDYFSKFK